MRPAHTLVAQTRCRIKAVHVDALRAWAHGEPIDGAKVDSQIDAILCGLVDAVAKAAAHKIRLSDE